MNIYEIAKKMELEGKKLYEDLLRKTNNEGLRAILKILINQEQSHYETFDMMEKNSKIKIKIQHFDGIKSYFAQMKEKPLQKEQLKFYEMVLSAERGAQKFYLEIAQKQTDPDVKMQIKEIIEEEHLHEIIIDNLIKYIQKPLDYVENAEFNSIEDEY